MKVGHYLLQPLNTAGQIKRQFGLVTVVNSDIGVHVPDQHTVQASKASLQIIEIPVHRVATFYGVIEVAVFDHHLRVHKIAL